MSVRACILSDMLQKAPVHGCWKAPIAAYGAPPQGHQECRMYEAKYPEVDDVVMVQVISIRKRI
jgi:hypothetical protein